MNTGGSVKGFQKAGKRRRSFLLMPFHFPTADNRSQGLSYTAAKIFDDMSEVEAFRDQEAALTSRPRSIAFVGTQISRTSDAISVKRAELLRIRTWAKARIGACTTAVQMHYADIVQRIETALGM